jgi:hypothetical protein
MIIVLLFANKTFNDVEIRVSDCVISPQIPGLFG